MSKRVIHLPEALDRLEATLKRIRTGSVVSYVMAVAALMLASMAFLIVILSTK